MKILFVEDRAEDVSLASRELRLGGFEFTSLVSETEASFRADLESFSPDLILSDYCLPSFDGMTALRIRNERCPLVPFILVTGSLDEETAVNCIKSGADDYILKQNLKRIAVAVQAALEKMDNLRRRQEAEVRMRASLAEKEVLLRELYHRTKNSMNVVLALLRIGKDSLADPAARTVLDDFEDRIYAMALAHDKLYEHHDLSKINLKDYFTDLVDSIRAKHPALAKRLDVVYDLDSVEGSIDLAVPLGMVVNELVTGCFHRTFPDQRRGNLRLSMRDRGDELELTIADDGQDGPGEPGKGSSPSIGIQLMTSIVGTQLKGTLTRSDDRGTRWTIRLDPRGYRTRI